MGKKKDEMFEAATAASKERSHAIRTVCQAERERHLFSHTGATLSEGGPGGARLRQHFTGLHKTIGNQAVLRMLSHSAPTIQPKLTINQPGDQYEQEADHVAEQVMRMPEPVVDLRSRFGGPPSSPSVQRKCACSSESVGYPCASCRDEVRGSSQIVDHPNPLSTPGNLGARILRKCSKCTAEEDQDLRANSGGLVEAPEDEIEMIGGLRGAMGSRFLQAKAATGERPITTASRVPNLVQRALASGMPIPTVVRKKLEHRIQYDFSQVRIHSGRDAAAAAKQLGALAFTTGSDIVFGEGRFAPQTAEGGRLLVHELTHVVQQGKASPLSVLGTGVPPAPGRSGGPPTIQRDLAVEPPNPLAVSNILSTAQIQAAIAFNQFRFKDPFDIKTVRDVLGLTPVPAIIDEEFVLAVVNWQSERNLAQDGKLGADTTRTFLGELRAEKQPALADDLARDNFVTTSNVLAPTFNACPIQPSFRWDVSFGTSLRNGFIIQEVRNVFNPIHCDGTAYVGPRPTPLYWEAWQASGAGAVTPQAGTINDMWQLGLCHHAAGPPRCANKDSRGTWRKTGRFFTVLKLPPGFAAGSVPDAGILLSTVAAPKSDDLGLVSGARGIGGTWNCCPPNNTHTKT